MNMIRKAVSVAMLAVLTLGLAGAFTEANAQAPIYTKVVKPKFLRNSASTADNPFVSANPSQTAYVVDIANGNHGANAGVALVFRDTTEAIYVGDHWIRGVQFARAIVTGGTAALNDSLHFGTLIIRSNKSTIDSVRVLRELSSDGVNWSVVDSLPAHLSTTGTIMPQPIAGDSAGVICAAAGGGRVGSLNFNANPAFGLGNVSGQAANGFAWQRFSVWMTAGDFAAAGSASGVTLEWQHPAFDANPLQPLRLRANE